MRRLTKRIDVARPEDYQLRSGNNVIALFKRSDGDVIVIYDIGQGELESVRVGPFGGHTRGLELNLCDLIEKPKKSWKNLYKTYDGSLWYDSKLEADLSAGPLRTGYLVCTDRADFSTYELVPLEGR